MGFLDVHLQLDKMKKNKGELNQSTEEQSMESSVETTEEPETSVVSQNIKTQVDDSEYLENIRILNAVSPIISKMSPKDTEITILNISENDLEGHAPALKMKRKREMECDFENKATKCIQDISDTVKTFQPLVIKTEDDVYGEYVGKCLASLISLKNKLEARKKIDQILFDAKLKEVE